ncbi:MULTISPECIES: threonine/serine exporter family protein [Anaerococcus]|uniref:threonine/serine exporter family protein n=1 Tax=Anaerococcus TaxID=165779 RepID=UPI001AE15527|nr:MULTISPECIES: threonine/serine exporter family protein [Anaerococcus]MBP2070328.1 uncharacterized membrane protein YjjP (DUF1212 family) [Anaerococcus nagyae]MDU1828891.1 threonine/serine exporter family protein [Anaerococcus sp.]MDU1864803.1 threonine/serine exporter family protein [Anaerococcus sp.]MDU2353261.1 threonine/serine exporter family protein [Anaerococcus sp.]MDU3211720.1 threonine/serine exporter family protein [Anaerococcus sp.]
MAHEKLTSIEDAVVLSEIAADAGALMLANGAEIYRVEDTVERILRSKESMKDVDVFSSFNVIMISFSYNGKIYSNMRRVKERGNNLHYVDKVNTFSRNFAAGKYTLDQALLEIDKIKKSKSTSTALKILGATVAAGAYSILLGAGISEIISSLVVGFIGYVFSLFLVENELNYFVVHFLYGALVSLITLILHFFTGVTINVVIISAMMAFVPGIMITNAVRDLMSGDALSGMTAATMAILISTALALGVAMPIGIWEYLI